MSEKIGLLGAGGQADEAISFESKKGLAFLAVNSEYVTREGMIDIEKPLEEHVDADVIAAVGAPAVKKKLVEAWSGENYTNVISEEAYIDKSVQIGKGCIVAPGSVITTNVRIGNHVLVNVAATVSHDSVIGDFATISPGAHIGGRVSVGEGAFIGIGSAISNDVLIASGVVIGAGAVVVENAEVKNGVYVGVPAKLIKINDGWLSEI